MLKKCIVHKDKISKVRLERKQFQDKRHERKRKIRCLGRSQVLKRHPKQVSVAQPNTSDSQLRLSTNVGGLEDQTYSIGPAAQELQSCHTVQLMASFPGAIAAIETAKLLKGQTEEMQKKEPKKERVE